MALASYLTLTEQLLQNPAAPVDLYDPAVLTVYINQSRGQLAGDSQAIKRLGTYTLTIGLQGPYPFSGVVLTPSTGIQGVLSVRQQWYVSGTGQLWVKGRSWPWYSQYHLNSATPPTGAPIVWAQYAEGEAGTLYVGNVPDAAYVMKTDCICYPIDLVDDSTAETIPAPWTVAIPYYAAYLALLSAQTGARVQDADRMFKLYETFVARARGISTPDIMPSHYPQQEDPTQQNKLGLSGGPG